MPKRINGIWVVLVVLLGLIIYLIIVKFWFSDDSIQNQSQTNQVNQVIGSTGQEGDSALAVDTASSPTPSDSDQSLILMRSRGKKERLSSTQLLDNWEKDKISAPAFDPFQHWQKDDAPKPEIPFPWNLFPTEPPITSWDTLPFCPPNIPPYEEAPYHPWRDY